MYDNGRKTIGVFICRTENYFQRTLCRGISNEARQLGYNVAFFSSFGNYLKNIEFGEGEKHIFSLPDYERLDGVILALDTFDNDEMKRQVMDAVGARCTCPVISIREKREGCYNFLVNNTKAMEGIIRHFIEFHHYKDICFLTGFRDDITSQNRLNSFIDLMMEYQLPVSEKNIAYGTFWKKDGKKACDDLLSQREVLPDAIICANDYMAISVSHELMNRGIRVPEDIAVGGYDGIAETVMCTPSMTTVKVPVFEMGSTAVRQISNISQGGTCQETTYFDVDLIIRESCGCQETGQEQLKKERRDFYEYTDARTNRTVVNTFMTIDLEGVEEMDQLKSMIHKYMELIENSENFHVCLQDIRNIQQEQLGFPDRMELFLSEGRHSQRFTDTIDYEIRTLLPTQVIDEEPQIYFFLPLHYKERCFGYTAVSFQDDACYGTSYQMWMVNLGNAIEGILSREKMRHLIEEMEKIYITDALTGVYNRHGFSIHAEPVFAECIQTGKKVFVVVMDMDGLKEINDTYGHSEGDYAIQLMANAIRKSALPGQVYARMGGDEFIVFGKCEGEKEATDFLESFQKYLNEGNAAGKKEYFVEVSCGYTMDQPESMQTIEHFMKRSDRKMYQVKADRKGR